MQLIANKKYNFLPVALEFSGSSYQDIFGLKNNKTLTQTLIHRRYAKLKDVAFKSYQSSLNKNLGEFLLGLKHKNDPFYKRFLNKYGDLTYSTFYISDKTFSEAKGIYAYVSEGNPVYIGRCRDSLKKRINQGYGKIHPKNCYLDGQATNCHLNAKIAMAKMGITLWLCQLENDHEIEVIEHALISRYTPPWNIQV